MSEKKRTLNLKSFQIRIVKEFQNRLPNITIRILIHIYTYTQTHARTDTHTRARARAHACTVHILT